MNRFRKHICCTVVLLLGTVTLGWAQDDAPSQEPSSGAAPAATGPDAGAQSIENPPLSGLDAPSFELGLGARSYLLLRAQASDAADTNPAGTLGSKTVVLNTVRGLGSATLQKLWKVHPLDIDYVGGVDWFSGRNGQVFQNHVLAANQRFLWRTGSLALRDAFSYVPQGSFGFGSFGGAAGFTGGLGGLGGGVLNGGGVAGGVGGGIFGSGQFGSLGNQPRITNMGIVDITQGLSPRSSVVLAGGYGVTDFVGAPSGYLNSNQTVAQVGYNYQLTRNDQMAVTYGYQQFHFPGAGAGTFSANVWQLFYGHRVSGKLYVSLGGGPQWIQRTSATLPSNSFISGSGRVMVRYRASARTSMDLTYSHYENSGSGFFAGASTNAARYSLNRSLTRRWDFMTDVGYSRSSRVLPLATQPAQNASSYSYWYTGGALHYQISRHFSGFTSYQFDSFDFSSGFCSPGTTCNRSYNRHVGLVGINWTPSPIRLD